LIARTYNQRDNEYQPKFDTISKDIEHEISPRIYCVFQIRFYVSVS
jgi:hypothetical protein